MPREPADKLQSSGHVDYDRKKDSDRHRNRERSPPVSRYRDRSSERYTRDRSSERYRSGRHRERSRSRPRNADRYRTTSPSRRSTSRSRHRSRSPRRQQHHSGKSSRHYSSKMRSQRSRSSSYGSSKASSRSRERSKSRRNSGTERNKESSAPASSQVHVYTSEELQQISHRNKTAADLASYNLPSSSSGMYQNAKSWSVADQASAARLAENFDETLDEPIDKERIHREMEEKLRLALAKEGKVYPPPKQEPSHPVFANDGSFLEIFKKMQQQMPTQQHQQSIIETAEQKTKNQPICKRRGGKILKTGIVAKSRSQETGNNVDPKDFWSIYLQEVKKYKNTSCDVDSKTRPLVK